MQLAITVLGNNKINFVAELLPAVRDCKCSIMEIRTTRLAQSTAAYMLVQGNWNQIAKFESTLELIQTRLEIKVHTLRPDAKDKGKDCLPYSLETISLDRASVVESITSFLFDREIEIEEITGSCYQAPYIQSSVFSTKFILLIPPQLHLLSLREEFLDFCDQSNIDAILEPIKR
ncbi:putative Glycine cleavage system transcriptional repressor [Crenothrix polyspora]|jgi:glycine cleavage system transcriptional repressor|uniref:Glycine cleavage system transcriptional repressor n=1 Tax=Crenothrix polyspora TaxID=360316 RepID=A0A1R4H8K5_9GAMM|nr:ACT domain-containing protein [Crenothrix polyspora]SJM92595.1 putative Glycine cleavage system transcriptional repressor [Crenothrix polyspora]